MKTHPSVWTLALLFVTFAAAIARAQGQLAPPQGEVSYQLPAQGFMRWTSNLLVGCDYCEGKPIVWTTDSQGYRESISFIIPGATFVAVKDVASGPDRSLAVVGLAISGSSRMGTFIGWISPDRSKQTIARVWPFAPNVVTVAPDGTLWAVGSVMMNTARRLYDNVLRHYSSSGQLLASTVLQHVRPQSNGFPEVSEVSTLMASQDRIGWLTSTCQYIEFSFDAVELGRYPCPNGYSRSIDVAGVALSGVDDLLVGGQWLGPLTPLELNRSTQVWTPMPVSQDYGKTWKILGFDGNSLVTASTSSTIRRYSLSGAAGSRGPGGQ